MKNSTRTYLLIIASMFLSAAPGFSADTHVSGLQSESANALKHLADRYADGAKGFADAAERADDQGLKAALQKKSEERAAYRQELLSKAGIEAEDTDGSIEGGAHRAWLNAKAAITGENDLAIVRTVRAGEEEAVKAFSDLLGQPLPADVRDTVQDQYEDVLESYKWAGDEIIKRSDDGTDMDDDMDDARDDMKDRADDANDAMSRKADEAKRKME